MTLVPYRMRIAHARRRPVAHAFTYRQVMWLVDLDDGSPVRWPLRWLARFEARDHLVAQGLSLKGAVQLFLGEHGRSGDGHRVLMLANARSFGYVFNPLTLYFCHGANGDLRCIVAEVHNTYGGRHRYLFDIDANGHGSLVKAFTVSPFLNAAGRYDLSVACNADGVSVAIAFLREGDTAPVFSATMQGRPARLTHPAVLVGTLLSPVASRLVTARIRWQGLRLWARGVPIVDGPHARRERVP